MSFCDENTEKSAGKTKKGEQEAFVAFEKRVTLVQDCVQLPPTDDKQLSNFCQTLVLNLWFFLRPPLESQALAPLPTHSGNQELIPCPCWSSSGGPQTTPRYISVTYRPLIGFQVSLRKSPVSDLGNGITSEVTTWWFYLQSISVVLLLLEQISAMDANRNN